MNIKKADGPISFEEAARLACNQNQVVRHYVGFNTKLRENNKLHDISERVRQYNNIRTTGLKPLVLEWIKTKEHNDGITKQTSQDSGNKGDHNYDQRKDGEKGNVV